MLVEHKRRQGVGDQPVHVFAAEGLDVVVLEQTELVVFEVTQANVDELGNVNGGTINIGELVKPGKGFGIGGLDQAGQEG